MSLLWLTRRRPATFTAASLSSTQTAGTLHSSQRLLAASHHDARRPGNDRGCDHEELQSAGSAAVPTAEAERHSPSDLLLAWPLSQSHRLVYAAAAAATDLAVRATCSPLTPAARRALHSVVLISLLAWSTIAGASAAVRSFGPSEAAAAMRSRAMSEQSTDACSAKLQPSSPMTRISCTPCLLTFCFPLFVWRVHPPVLPAPESCARLSQSATAVCVVRSRVIRAASPLSLCTHGEAHRCSARQGAESC